ncbi:hypothetical protein MY5147_006177 [Beauveria neobassiana]
MASVLVATLTMPSQSGFSVLPPPPRYPGVGGYGVGGLGGIVPLVETNNTIEKPTGSEWQFLVGEGTYVLRDDLSLATPPPHPSEAPIVNPNPLATNPQPASSGTKLSLVSLHPKPPPFVYRGAAASSFGGLASLDGSNDLRYSTEGGMSSEDGRAASNSDNHGPQVAVGSAAPAFGYGNMALTTAVTKDVNKRKKPKNNVTKSNSSFISRVIVSDSLSRRLTDRPSDGIFAFANINRAFQWLDMSSYTKQEYLVKILFTKAHCLCHDVNKSTKGASHLDVVMGFSTGEIIWLEPISQRYTRLNKNGVINNTPVAHVNWLPGSENLFLAAHMDGSLIVYDKEKEDAAFTPEDEASSNGGSDAGDATIGNTPGISMVIRKSVHSKNQKINPVAAWKLSNQRIHAFSFSPDHRHLAVVSEDGTLRIIDYLREDVGEDGRLCLWDFSAAMLHRPQTNRHRSSISSHVGQPERVSSYDSDESPGIAHAVEPRARIPMLPPVMTKVIDKHPLCFLEFTEDAIITSCKNGHIRTWNRPGMGAAVEPNSSEAASS